MDHRDISRRQAEIMAERIGQNFAYLEKILERMNQEEFPDDDPLRELVQAAYSKEYALWVHLYYRSLWEGRGH